MERYNSVDLNIVDRGLEGQAWTSEKGQITREHLAKVKEQKTDNGGALNSLPTPFARFFIFREAFRRIYENKKNLDNEAGEAYRMLVSDCLDVFELLFNMKYHHNHWGNKREIVIKEWNSVEDLERLGKQSPVLRDSIKMYYKKDINMDRIFFVLLKENGKERLLATSSPITGFVTPPDLDRKGAKNGYGYSGARYEGLKLYRKPKEGMRSRGCYFRDVELFEERPADFKNYMFHMFDGVDVDSFFEIKQYVKSFADTDTDIRNDYAKSWKPIVSENNESLDYCGITICASEAKDVTKLFADSVIKLPYRVSEENFYTPKFIGKEDRSYDYLLPLTDDAVTSLDISNVDCSVKEFGLGKKIEVTLKLEGKEYKKQYTKDIANYEGMGRIIDFSNPFNVNMELGLFPNIKSPITRDNNYYKLMLVTSDDNRNRQFDIQNNSCIFFAPNKEKTGNVILEEADSNLFTNGVRKPIVRSVQKEGVECSTKFYEVFNTEISALSLHLEIEGGIHTGVLIPKFHEIQKQTKVYTYAIDFGTSNTYISKREKGSSLEPQQMRMSNTMMSYLHERNHSRQKSLIENWDDIPFARSLEFFQTEFVPPFIDGSKYKFPLRTAIVKSKQQKDLPSLFDSHNIAFSYEKKKITGENIVSTNIKWDENTNDARLFIRELLIIVKCDALLSEADLSQTDIVWFYPLSLSQKAKAKFEEIWHEEASNIIGESVHLLSYTESEAPYYYYAEKDEFDSIDSVAVIDIGGGSTDIVYFKEGMPKLANSVHFGCDVLWGNGYNKMSNARDNGIFQRYAGKLSFGENSDLFLINSEMSKEGSSASTCDIINFWIGNSSSIKIGEDSFNSVLREEAKPLFLYHYASIIYYMAKLFKVQGLDCPNAITFSGNGSLYIDNCISSDIETLTDVTMVALKDVFGDNISRVQLILTECRKEATCYGGLYRKQSVIPPKAVVFNGVDAKEYDNIEELTKDYQHGELKSRLIDEIGNLSEVYIGMLRVLVKNDEIENINTPAIEKEIKKGNDMALDKNFKEEIRDKMDPSVKYKDSLFFIPIIDKIKDLTFIDKFIK